MSSSGVITHRSKLATVGWVILAIHAVVVGVASLRYLLPHVPFAIEMPNFLVRRGWLVAHAGFSSIALLAGPWQFLEAVRRRKVETHHWIGRIYCGAVAAGWITSIPIAAHAQTGAIASAGFLALGTFWISATTAGFLSIYRGQVQAHREWMTRSYALTAAAITLRSYLPVLTISGVPFEISYRIVAWACWIPNLLFAEWLVRRRRTVAKLVSAAA